MTSELPEAKVLDEQPHKLSAEDLSKEHCDALLRAIHNVLSTPSVEEAYAQIVDGALLNEVYNDIYGPVFPLNHPLLHDYNAASPGSRAFKTRLVEILAASIHQIAVTLYKLDLSLGNHRDSAAWVAPTSDKVFYWGYPDGKLPSLFFHDQYQEHSQHPEAIADMVGYWAESQTFCGVVLFDRHRPDEREPHEDPDALYFHSDQKMVIYRIWQLLDTQKKKQLLDFLLAEPNSFTSPFPILADDNNLTRIDPEEPIRETGIYRDLWERKPLGDDDGDSRSHCCAYSCLDYPSIADYKRSRQRYWDRKAAKEEKKEEEIEAMEREAEAEGVVDEEAEEEDEMARVLKKS